MMDHCLTLRPSIAHQNQLHTHLTLTLLNRASILTSYRTEQSEKQDENKTGA